jgi:hypothetical protein
VPEQAPLHPVNPEPEEALAVKVTVVPKGKSAEQADPQEIPEGLEVTVPEPVPDLDSCRRRFSSSVVRIQSRAERTRA